MKWHSLHTSLSPPRTLLRSGIAAMLTVSLALDACALLAFGALSLAAPDWLWTLLLTGSDTAQRPPLLSAAVAVHLSRLFGLFVVLFSAMCVLAACYKGERFLRRVVATFVIGLSAFSILFDLWLLVDASLEPWAHLGVNSSLMLINVAGLIVDLFHAETKDEGRAARAARRKARGGASIDGAIDSRSLLFSMHDAAEAEAEEAEANASKAATVASAASSAQSSSLSSSSSSLPSDDCAPSSAASSSVSVEEAPDPGWSRLLALAGTQQSMLVAGCVALLVRLPFSLAVPHFVSECLGAVISGDLGQAWWSITALAIAGTIDAILDFFNFYLFGLAQQRVVKELRIGLFQNILRQEMGFFDATSIGFLTSRLNSDTAEMSNNLTFVFRFSIESVVRIGGIMTYMFLREWRLALAACTAIPVIALVNRHYGRWLHDNAQQVQSALAEVNSVAQETLSSIRTVFSFANEGHEVARFSERIEILFRLNVRQLFLQSIYYMVIATFLVNCVVQAGLLAYGSRLVFAGQMETSALIAFMLYQGQLQGCCQNLFDTFNSLLKSTGAGAKVFALLDRTPLARVAPVPQTPAVAACRGRVCVRNVSFRYASRPEQRVLDRVSFDVNPGEVVALVGPSGSGKSTIFHLIENLYQPASGSVTLDGVDIFAFDHRRLHSIVGIVSQEPVLFSGTIEDNILYSAYAVAEAESAAQDETSMSAFSEFSASLSTAAVDVEPIRLRKDRVRAQHRLRLLEVARIANAHDFVSALPDGYQTEVGERGTQLSGGQKQRIAIARALLQDPKVLLLDEATSALDSQSEALVQQALERAMRGRTTLVIAHRLSTIAHADRIVVFDAGRVVESGTHAELMERALPAAGSAVTYRALVARQVTPAV